MGRSTAKNRSLTKQILTLENSSERTARLWLRYSPTFRLPDVLISELEGRPKNASKDIAAAEATIRGMNDLQPDACSFRLVDENEETMVCVFSHRLPSEVEEEDSSEADSEEDDSEAEPEVFPPASTLTELNTKRAADSGLPRLEFSHFGARQQLCFEILGWNSCR